MERVPRAPIWSHREIFLTKGRMLSKKSLAVYGRAAIAISGIEGERASELSRAEKNKLILGELRQALNDTGALYIVGGVPVHVMPDGRMTEILPSRGNWMRS